MVCKMNLKCYFYTMKFCICAILVCFTFGVFAQKNITALEVNESISLDASFNEPAWSKVQWESNFTTLKPIPGKIPSKPTEVAILYDKEAIYFGVKCHDHEDSVSRVLSTRDDFNPNLDLIGIFLRQ